MIFTERPFLAPNATHDHPNLAVLKCLLMGYGIEVDDQSLQDALKEVEAARPSEAADVITQIASRLGLLELAIEKHPTEHLLDANILPALVRLGSVDGKPPYFVLVWNSIGPVVQLMDPMQGRRWVNKNNLLENLHHEVEPITEAMCSEMGVYWRPFLQERLKDLHLEDEQVAAMLNQASDGLNLATLDAATRMVTSMVEQGGVKKGTEAKQILAGLYEEAGPNPPVNGMATASREPIHPAFWSVCQLEPERESTSSDEEVIKDGALAFGGVTVIRVIGQPEMRPQPSVVTPDEQPEQKSADKPTLWSFLLQEGYLTLGFIGFCLVLSSATVFFQAILLRGLMEAGLNLEFNARVMTILVLFGLALTLFFVRWPLEHTISLLGRKLDARLRLAVFGIIPDLSPQYFQNQPIADMIERIHKIRTVDFLTGLIGRFIWLASQVVLTIIGIAVIDLWSAPLAVVRTIGVIIVSVGFSIFLSGYNLTLDDVLGKLSRSYLDAMQGLTGVRTHGAEKALRYEYDNLLVKWAKGRLAIYGGELSVSVINQVLSFLLMSLILIFYAYRDGSPANFLLLVFWAFNLDILIFQMMLMFLLYLRDNGKATRYLALLDAPKERDLLPAGSDHESNGSPQSKLMHAVEIMMQDISLELGGRMVLSDINLTIEAGSQVAIVGPSGAGKSTLISLIMGWVPKGSGQIWLDGEALNYENLQELRHQTAWIDPNVQLWNRSLLYNLRYGSSPAGEEAPLNDIIKKATLSSVLKRLPEGFSTPLGQEGRLLSGGEGQRVRFARAMQRPDARFVVLDEAFRGLDRPKRRQLLADARAYWQDATMICITHDVGMTLDFERVLVIDHGGIVEDGSPKILAEQIGSRYRSLLTAEKAVRESLWVDDIWRHLWLEEGQLTEQGARGQG